MCIFKQYRFLSLRASITTFTSVTRNLIDNIMKGWQFRLSEECHILSICNPFLLRFDINIFF